MPAFQIRPLQRDVLATRCSRWSVLLVLLLSVGAAHVMRAQALTDAAKGMDIVPFGGFLVTWPAITGTPPNTGGAIGIDITRYFHRFPIAPSLEGRANLGYGTVATEKSYVFGLKLEATPVLVRYRPYVTFLVGPGTVHYVNSTGAQLRGDNSTVYAYGAGVDIDLPARVRAKVDYQYQSWKLGTGDQLTPTMLLVGLSYRIPFKPHFGYHD